MTAVASPPSLQPNPRAAWGANVNQGGLSSMNADEVARMFMPRKSAQRANSSSSISSNSSASSTSTISQPPTSNGVLMSSTGELSSWGTAAAKKKPQRAGAGPWPTAKSEASSGISTARPQSILTSNGASAASSINNLQPSSVVPSQQLQTPPQQANGIRTGGQGSGDANPVLYLLSMNGTFERKTISVPYYPDSLRIGRQTNAKTLPTPANGFFDSKVLSRQHAEIWADRNGKIWIRDVKSSNGTFVNAARLSPENRDSEPHELQTHDQLELGIDIVSEDQKTVVHHKVAAKVEHAGYLGSTNNILDMNFGDLDPANGAMMVPSQGAQMRGRSGSQGSLASNGRVGAPASVASSQMGGMGQQRAMNFWLTPVTTEQIVKRLTQEMRAARLQSSDLGRADHFVGSLLSKESVKEIEKAPVPENVKPPQPNGNSIAFRGEAKPRFSEPPAPPPQQPLPEKPDVARSHAFESSSSPVLKRTNTERPLSAQNVSPIRQEPPTSQILSLVEALATAKKELDTQSARMRDLEEMLAKERQAREVAEETAKRLEESYDPEVNGHANKLANGFVLEDAFEPPLDSTAQEPLESVELKTTDVTSISASTLLLEQRLEKMLSEMHEMREHMDTFKRRAESAEAERDAARQTLAEMVLKIRSTESVQRSVSTERGRSPASGSLAVLNGSAGRSSSAHGHRMLEKAGLSNGSATGSSDDAGRLAAGTLSKHLSGQSPLVYHTSPYASMLGVVIIGMGLMAYLNGWQPPKAE